MLEKKHLVFLAGATAPFAPPLCTALPGFLSSLLSLCVKEMCRNAVFAHLTLYPKIFSRFHHQAYYELTMACSPVGLLSSVDRVLRLVTTMVKPEFFQVLFRALRLFTLLQWSLSYLYPQFKILFVLHILIQVISTNGYLMNSQWPVLQLAWWAQWMELCIQSLQRSGFDFWSSLNILRFFFNCLQHSS